MTKICYTVDVEGDVAAERASSVLGVRFVMPRILRFFAEHSIRATLFIQEDDLCPVGSRFASMWHEAEAAGHEIGLHVHGLIGASAKVKREKIALGATRLRTLGFAVRSYRSGRYHLTPDMPEMLADNGLEYDSSVVPGLRECFADGAERCNHIGAPITPSYLLLGAEGARPIRSNVIEIPINRYPNVLPEQGLKLNGPGDELLYDYFRLQRKDERILLNLHSWDGLCVTAKCLMRKPVVRSALTCVAPLIAKSRLVSQGYFDGLERLVVHMHRSGGIEFVRVCDIGDAYRAEPLKMSDRETKA